MVALIYFGHSSAFYGSHTLPSRVRDGCYSLCWRILSLLRPVSSCLHIGKILLLLTLHVCSFGSPFGCCCLFNYAVNFIYVLCLFLWLLKRFLVSLYNHVANNQNKESL